MSVIERFSIVVILALTMLMAASSDASALCGGPNPPCARYWSAEAVFIGTVESVRSFEVRNSHGEAVVTVGNEVRLTVLEAFRGVSDRTVTLNNQMHGESVDYRRGETYFVYAYRDEERGVLSTSSCGTRTLAESQDSVEYARWIATGPALGRVFGSILHEQWDPERNESVQHPFPPGITVTLTGPAGVRSMVPISNGPFGRFQFDDVPVGTYELSVLTEGPFAASESQAVTVRAPLLCAEAFIQLRWDATLRGRVLDAEGRPVPFCPVAAVTRTHARVRHYRWEEVAASDEQGEFVHSRLAPGEYLLGVHIQHDLRGTSEYPVVYFPGVPDLESAEVVRVVLGSQVDVGDLRLPVRVDKVPIEGTVLMSDGSPALDAVVGVYSDDTSFEHLERWARTDSTGRFRILGVAGRRYSVSAWLDHHDGHLAGAANAIPGRQDAVVIRLEKSAGRPN